MLNHNQLLTSALLAASLSLFCAGAAPAIPQGSFPPYVPPSPPKPVSLAQYGAVCDGHHPTQDTAALTTALAFFSSSPTGAAIYFPAGDCNFTQSFSITVNTDQRLILASDGMQGGRLHWSNSASYGFAITLAQVTGGAWLSSGPNVDVHGLSADADWSTTTTGAFLSISAPAGPYQRPLPPAVSISNVTGVSSTNSGGIGTLVALNGVGVSKFDNIFLWASAGDTTAGLLTLGNSYSAPQTGFYFHNLRQQSGGTAVTVTDYIQGVFIDNLQTVGTQHSISWTNPGGYTGADSLTVTDGQMNSLVSEITTSAVNTVILQGNYFLGNTVGWNGISISGGITHAIANNVFKTTYNVPSGDTSAKGVWLSNVIGSSISNNVFYGFTGTGSAGAPIGFTNSTISMSVTGNNSETGTMLVYDDQSAASAADGSYCVGNIINLAYTPAGCNGGDQNINLGHYRWGSSANSLNASGWSNYVAGQSNTVGNVQESFASGLGNNVTGTRCLTSGEYNLCGNTDSTVVGKRGKIPYIGAFAVANSQNPLGGAEQLFWTWQERSTSTTAFRATADGTGTIADYNIFGLDQLGSVIGGTFQSITVTAFDGLTNALLGTWSTSGTLSYDSPTATWAGGSVSTTGSITSGAVSIAADSSNGGGLNIQITPPSTDTIVWTIAFNAIMTAPF